MTFSSDARQPARHRKISRLIVGHPAISSRGFSFRSPFEAHPDASAHVIAVRPRLPKATTKRLAEIEAKGVEITVDKLHEACRMAPRWSIDNADKLGDLIFAFGGEVGFVSIPPECRESFVATLGLSPDRWRMSDVKFKFAEILGHMEAKGLNIEYGEVALACTTVERLTRDTQAIRALLREYANPSGRPEDIPAGSHGGTA